MTTRAFIRILADAVFFLPATATAETSITDVVNAASRIPNGFPSWGVAQGALFAILGKELGPAELQQASFPLPAGDGLSGVTVKVTVGDTTVDAILVYVSDIEIGAILPSQTPAGTGTVTVNNNGATATGPINVLSSAFGIFALNYGRGYQSAVLNAAAFVLGDEGRRDLNYLASGFAVAKPGQTVELHGTGLGAVTGDETQAVGSEAPNAQIKVFVGATEATVAWAGRGEWPGLPEGFPAFPVPKTIAAWDVVRFVVPEGVVGCRVSVVVQSGNLVSNSVWISVSADGGACVDSNAAAFGEPVTVSGTVRTASINLVRIMSRITLNSVTTELGSESGSANFFQYDVPAEVTVPASVYATLAYGLDPGTCIVIHYRDVPSPPSPNSGGQNTVINLDAGEAINVKGSGGSKPLPKTRTGGYAGPLGSSFSLPGVPPMNNLFLNPGTFTVDNGSGGPDIPAFTGNATQPPVIAFDNVDQLASIDRSKGVTVRWSGGDPNGFVTVVGTSFNTTGPAGVTGIYACSERISAGQIVVPPFVTMNLPVTASRSPAPPVGTISLWTYVTNRIEIPTMNIAFLSMITDVQRTALYQ